jgi:hypothetical protein
LINNTKKVLGYRKITLQTWDQAAVVWKQELLDEVFRNEKVKIMHETVYP